MMGTLIGNRLSELLLGSNGRTGNCLCSIHANCGLNINGSQFDLSFRMSKVVGLANETLGAAHKPTRT